MSKNDSIFLYVGVYDDVAGAEADYESVKTLHLDGVLGTYDAAVITTDGDKVKVHKHEKPTQHGAWTGLVVGGVVGLIFPPALLGGAVVTAGGAAVGGVIGHLWKGISRSDLKELGEQLDEGQAALIVIAKDKFDEAIDAMYSRARKAAHKALAVDHEAMQADIDAAFVEATSG